MLTRRARNLPTQHSGLGANRSTQRINRNSLHPGKINDQAVRTSPSQVTVPAGARGHFQFVTPRKLHRSQRILLVSTFHDGPRSPFRSRVPVKDPSVAFIGGIAGEYQAPFEFGAQRLDRAAHELVFVGYLKTPAGGYETEHSGDGNGSFYEVASSLPAHVRAMSHCTRLPFLREPKNGEAGFAPST
jgi:hypothetical protein